MAYTDQGEIEKYLGVDITGIDTFVDGIIASVKSWIDRYTQTNFESGADTKYYDGNGERSIFIDFFTGTPTEVSILEEDGDTHLTLTEGHGEDYLRYPLNETAKNQLVLTDSASVSSFYKGVRRLKVTANFGSASSVPDDIKLCATMLASKVIEKSLKGGNPKTVKLDIYSVTFKDIDEVADPLGVYNILDQYREIEI